MEKVSVFSEEKKQILIPVIELFKKDIVKDEPTVRRIRTDNEKVIRIDDSPFLEKIAYVIPVTFGYRHFYDSLGKNSLNVYFGFPAPHITYHSSRTTGNFGDIVYKPLFGVRTHFKSKIDSYYDMEYALQLFEMLNNWGKEYSYDNIEEPPKERKMRNRFSDYTGNLGLICYYMLNFG